jgi:hexulose-6-phosphate isomerase
MNRRCFLRTGALAVCAAAPASTSLATSASANRLKKAVCIGVLSEGQTIAEKFDRALKAGFEGVEPNTLRSAEEVREYKAAAASTGIKIHSLMNSDHWKFPLTDNDPEVVTKCLEGIRTSMRNAHELGADTVLLVPGIVTANVRYDEVYKRSQRRIHELLPLAKELGVVLAIENVGNRFLLSPLEFVRYIDELASPFVKGYFDVGNVVTIGYPPDWIRTIGPRLHRVHVKRFEPGADHPRFAATDRRTEGIDWPDVCKALGEVGYSGWVTAEVRGGDANYLRELSARMDRIFAGQPPEV